MKKETEFEIEGMEEATKNVNNLIAKLQEARTLADDLASSKVYINDMRKMEIDDLLDELRLEFIASAGYEPFRYYLVAEGDSFQCRTTLLWPKRLYEK